MRLFLLVLSLLVSVLVKSYAQTSITVHVVDSLTKTPIVGATVEGRKTADSLIMISTMTDKAGKAVISVTPVIRSLTVSCVGYRHQTISVTEQLGRDLTVYLVTNYQLLKEISVLGRKSPITVTPDGYRFTLDDKLRNLSVNAGQLLKTLPDIIPGQYGELKIMDKNVVIYIDGRPSNLSGEELNQFLTSLNLNDVKEFKILSNPSAEYSANGGAIIDIRMRKIVADGALFRLDGGLGSHDKYNLGGNIDYKSKKYTGKFNFNYFNNNISESAGYTQSNLGSGQTRYAFSSRTNDNPTRNLNASLNNYYALDGSTTLGLVFRYSRFKTGSTLTDSYLDVTGPNERPLERRHTLRNDESDANVYFTNLNLRRVLDKKGTALDLDGYYWGRWNNSNYNIQQYIEPDRGGNSLMLNNVDQKMALNGGNAKLTHPFTKTLLMTTGAQYSTFTIHGNFNNQLADGASGTVLTDENNTYDLDYSERLFAGYVNFSGQFKKVRYVIGLRAEDNNIQLSTDQSFQNTLNRNHNFGFYPNTAAIFTLTKSKTLTFAYNRKIWRVSYSQLNPINTSSDPTNITRGNPELTPSKADSYSLRYNLSGKNPLMASLTFQHETNPYMWVTQPAAMPGVYLTTPLNFNYNNYLTFSFYKRQSITKSFSLSSNFSTSLTYLNLERLNLPNRDWFPSVKATLTANLSFWKNAAIQLFGNFKSRSVSTLGSMGNYQYVDFAFSKPISKQLTVNLTVNDFLNVNKFTYRNESSFLINSGYTKRETRIARLSISYSFGGTKENKLREFDPYEDDRTQN